MPRTGSAVNSSVGQGTKADEFDYLLDQFSGDNVLEDAQASSDAVIDQTLDQPTDGISQMGTPLKTESFSPDEVAAQEQEALLDEVDPTRLKRQDMGFGPASESLWAAPGNETAEASMSPIGQINRIMSEIEDGTDVHDLSDEDKRTLAHKAPNEWFEKDLHKYRPEVSEYDDTNPDGSMRPSVESAGKLTWEDSLSKMQESHTLGRAVQAQMDKLAFGMSIEEQTDMMNRIDEGGFEPQSVNEFMSSIVSTQKQLAEVGIPQALSDISLHSVYSQIADDMVRVDQSGDPTQNGGDLSIQQAKTRFAHQNEAIGFKVLGAMGVKGNKTTAATAGAIAIEMVTQALPEQFSKNQYGSWELTDPGMLTVENMLEMTNLIIPGAKKMPRYNKKESVPKSKAPRKSATNADHGSQDWNNKVKSVMNNQGFRANQDMIQTVNVLSGQVDPETGATLIDKLVQKDVTEEIGTFNNRSSQRILRNKEGIKVRNKNYVPHDGMTEDTRSGSEKNEFVMEFYLGSKIKDFKFNETMDWAEEVGDRIFFYDHFVGSNNRFYIDQTVGNYQSDKLTRALLSAEKDELYDLGSTKDLNVLKAGIMKKHGFDSLGVAAAAAEFDSVIEDWSQNMADLQGTGGAIVIEEAAGKEGWASISAMVEAVKLHAAIKEGKKSYTSNFFTEIDGVANGLAHNAMQSGDAKVARLTNLNPDGWFEEGKGRQTDQDVYTLAGAGLRAHITKMVGDDAEATKLVYKALGLDDDRSLRDFAKSPLMIFQYGAGKALVKAVIKEKILQLAAGSSVIAGSLKAALGNVDVRSDFSLKGKFTTSKATRFNALASGYNFEEKFTDNSIAALNQIVDSLGEQMWSSINTDFGGIQKLTHLMSALAEEADVQNRGALTPGFSIEGHKVPLGLKEWTVDEVRSFVSQGINVDVSERILDTKGRQKANKFGKKEKTTGMKDNYKYNPSARASRNNQAQVADGTLKSATQIAVLMTHSLDGINIGRSILNLADESLGVGHVFDGIFVTPKNAEAVAKQLNNDFMRIHADYSFLHILERELHRVGFNWNHSKESKALRRTLNELKAKQKALFNAMKRNKATVKQFFWD